MLLFLPWLLVEIFTLKSEHLNYRGIIGGLSAANIQYVTCCQEYMTANRKLTRGLDSLPCRCCFVSQHIHVHWTIFPTARRNTPSEKRLSWNKKTVIFHHLPLDSPVNLYQSSRWCITHIYIAFMCWYDLSESFRCGRTPPVPVVIFPLSLFRSVIPTNPTHLCVSSARR